MWPSGSGTINTTMAGNTLVTADDHALNHRQTGSVLNSLPTVFGITSGTNLLRGVAAASDQLLVLNSGGTANQAVQKGTINNGVLGSPTITGGTINNPIMGTPSITGGTGNGMTFGTPTIGSITVPGTLNALGFSAAIAPGVGTITDTVGTLTINAQQGNIFYSVMGTSAGNRTLATPLNPSPYQLLTFAFKTSGSANGTLIFGTAFRISQDIGTPTLGTGVSWNYYGFRFNNIDSHWDFCGQQKDLV